MVVMSVVAGSAAASAQEGGRIVLAAATSNTGTAMSAPRSYPRLFGTSERKSRDTSAFTKWNTMLARFERDIKTTGETRQIKRWEAKMQDLSTKSVHEKVVGVNNFINAIKYKTDSKVWKKSDYWATPVEFFANGGDCEDYAIAKYASLRALGVPNSRMRIVIVQDNVKRIPHAILVVYTDRGTMVLDNQNKSVLEAAELGGRYSPIFSINQGAWWLHS